jgi:hypothetical protein
MNFHPGIALVFAVRSACEPVKAQGERLVEISW